MNTILLYAVIHFIGLATCGVSAEDEDIPEPPSYRFTTQDEDVTILAGETVTFRCAVENAKNWQFVIWQNGTNSISFGRTMTLPGDRVTIEGSGDQYDLVLRDIDVSDEGTYTCQLSGLPPLTQIHKLTVNIPPTIQMQPEQLELDAKVYQTVALACYGDGKPYPDVTWTREGKNFETGQDVIEGEALTLADMKAEDSGKYTCTATNDAGTVSQSIQINVIYPPEVKVKDTVIHTGPGHEVSIECQFQANPNAEVVWMHNNTDINLEERNVDFWNEDDRWYLKIGSLQPSDLGTYTCMGGNSEGRAYGDIFLTALPRDLEITSSDDGPYSNQYTVQWQVLSIPDLIEFTLMVKLVNNTEETEWWNSTIPSQADFKDPSTGLHKQQYTLSGLEANSTYRIKLRAKNVFGKGTWTKVFKLHTSDGMDRPLSASPVTLDIVRHLLAVAVMVMSTLLVV